MLLKTADWDDALLTHNALATESSFLSWEAVHEFGDPAKVKVFLSDPSGTIAQKYDVDPANDSVYVGPGRAYIEDPTGTAVFDGRIVRSILDMNNHRVILECEDWLSQLDDDLITYDMREDLDPDDDVGLQGIRESTLSTDLDSVVYLGPAFTNAGVNRVFDSRMNWDNDQFNGYSLVLSGRNAGDQTILVSPYTHTGGANMTASGWENIWVDDSNKDYANSVGIGDLIWIFTCRVIDEGGSLFNSLDSMTIRGTIAGNNISGDQITIGIDHDIDATVYPIGTLTSTSLADIKKFSFDIPGQYLSGLLTNLGTLPIYIYAYDDVGVDAELDVYFLQVEAHVNTDGYSTAIAISDTAALRELTVDTNCFGTGLGVWEGCRYSIAKPIYKHIDTGESGTLVSDGDVLYTLTCAGNVEHTSGISLRHYQEYSRLKILQDLSSQDDSVFWIPLGTTAITWKSTFNNGAPTAMTDASVLQWKGDWNYKSMYNEAHVYGATVNDIQIYASDSDATSQATYGIARAMSQSNTGVVTNYDCESLADSLVTRNKDCKLYLEAVIGGLSTLRIGDEVSITSTYLGLAAAVYTITHWSYDSKSYRTTIRLQPRASTTGYQSNESFDKIKKLFDDTHAIKRDKYIAEPYTNIWS